MLPTPIIQGRRPKRLAYIFLVITLFVIETAYGQTFKVLHAFDKNGVDGATPYGGLVAKGGSLYGTTQAGGAFDQGTIFKIDPNGKESVVFSLSGAGGEYPLAGLAADAAGNLYGTTSAGGDLNRCWHNGCGTIFKVDHVTAHESGVHRLTLTEGADPYYSSVVMDQVGNAYGTSRFGGDLSCNPPEGCGTVWEIDKHGHLTVLYSFNGVDDQGIPLSGVIFDSQGNLYGTVEGSQCGGVFKLDTTGVLTMLHVFDHGNWITGCDPKGGLVLDATGSLYGTTFVGGDLSCNGEGCGIVFKIDGDGTFTVLYNFRATPDGEYPIAGLIADAQGNLFGTTWSGGSYNRGSVFELDRAGNETVLHSFDLYHDGGVPLAPLIFDSRGNLYGTTSWGANGWGTVFSLTLQ